MNRIASLLFLFSIAISLSAQKNKTVVASAVSDDWIYNNQLSGATILPGNYLVKLFRSDSMLVQRNFSVVGNPKIKSNQNDLQA